MLEEMRKTESEVYWDLGTVTIYTMFFFIIYFVVWMFKLVLKLFVAKQMIKIVSVKMKKVLVKLFPVLEGKGLVENEEKSDGDLSQYS